MASDNEEKNEDKGWLSRVGNFVGDGGSGAREKERKAERELGLFKY